MQIEKMAVGTILPVSRFNKLMQDKWNRDYNAFSEEMRANRRHYTESPQLAFYLYFNARGNARTKGYVLITPNGSLCKKTKEECLIEKNKKNL